MSEPTTAGDVCLITGVGPGTGAALARSFARAGYRVAMLARTAERLAALAARTARARTLSPTMSPIRGPWYAPSSRCAPSSARRRWWCTTPSAGTFADFLEAKPEDLVRNFQIYVMALFHLARLSRSRR